MDPEMNQPLTNGDAGESASQASSQSRSKLEGSLLDRIRATQDRSREFQPASEQPQGQMVVGSAAPSQITIPNYEPQQPHPQQMVDHTDMSDLGSSSFLGGFGGGTPAGGMGESLLGGQQQPNNSQYSMSGYFQTFVEDVYNLFRSLPIWAQVVLVIFLIFLVIKWI